MKSPYSLQAKDDPLILLLRGLPLFSGIRNLFILEMDTLMCLLLDAKSHFIFSSCNISRLYLPQEISPWESLLMNPFREWLIWLVKILACKYPLEMPAICIWSNDFHHLCVDAYKTGISAEVLFKYLNYYFNNFTYVYLSVSIFNYFQILGKALH